MDQYGAEICQKENVRLFTMRHSLMMGFMHANQGYKRMAWNMDHPRAALRHLALPKKGFDVYYFSQVKL